MSRELSFGGWLRRWRTEHGVTRDELAERIGCSLELLRKLESGERRPSGQIAHLLADYFRIPADEQEAFVTFARTGRAAPLAVSAGYERTPNSADASAPWRQAYIQQTNLPAMLTSLLGRERERDAARSLIGQPRIRLLTLTGPPGVGKTRMAVELAADLVDSFNDGVYFVDLAPVTDPDLVLSAVAHTLNVRETGGMAIEDVLGQFVRDKRMLLVLDNFEQVLDAGPAVVGLMHAGSWLKVLVTSREALRVRGERRVQVPPLPVPDLEELPTLEVVAGYSSVELFVERAQDVAPDFALTEANAMDVAAICAGLEGLPLAIELAAARAGHLSPHELRAALHSRLQFLTEGARDLPTRQRTLYSAIAWSYNLLEEAEQRLFRRLGVFAGGFTAEAAERVSDLEGTARLATLLELLVGKSLIREERRNETLRFGMLETIREFALEQLAANGEEAEAHRLHTVYFLALAEALAPMLEGAEQESSLAGLQAEYENLRAALAWSLGQGEDAEAGLRLGSALLHFWLISGYLAEGRQWLERALNRGQAARAHVRAQALNAAGHLARRQGDLPAARPLHEASLALYRELGDASGIATVLNNLGLVLRAQGDYPGALACFEEALARWRELGNKRGIATSLNGLGILTRALGDQTAAHALFAESLVLYRETGDQVAVALLLSNLGLVLTDLGDLAEAQALHEESLAMKRELGDKQGVATSLHFLGQLTAALKDYVTASAYFEESLAMNRQLGDKQSIAGVIGSLGDIEYAMGNYTRAYALKEEGIALYREMGERGSVAVALRMLGTMMLNQGDITAAQMRFEESLAIQRELGNKSAMAKALKGLGAVAYARGDYDGTRALLAESLAIEREIGSKDEIPGILAGLGRLAVHIGEAHRGARLLGASAGLRETLGLARDPRDQWEALDSMIYEQGIAAARAALGEEEFMLTWTEGRTLNVEEAVEYAQS